MPKRIQRRRTKGWRKPEGAVYVGRGSKWGNPIIPGHDYEIHNISTGNLVTQTVENLDVAAALFSEVLYGRLTVHPFLYPSVEDIRRELAGKDLMCWCPFDQLCHAVVLLAIANSEDEQ